MPTRLKRYYGAKHLHFITGSCYHRLPILDTPERRDLLLQIIEDARQKYRFVVVGYVVMPEHLHLLMSEPEQGDPSVVMKVIKERFSRLLHKGWPAHSRSLRMCEDENVWQRRFYDFNVWSEKKRIEKLKYIHRNPVKRGLVEKPEQWRWSSYRSYAFGEPGIVRINVQEWPLKIKPLPRQTFSDVDNSDSPLIRKKRE